VVFGCGESESGVGFLIPVSDPDFGIPQVGNRDNSRNFNAIGVFGYGDSESGVGFLIPLSDPDFRYRIYDF
jgi:hypothetical protein